MEMGGEIFKNLQSGAPTIRCERGSEGGVYGERGIYEV